MDNHPCACTASSDWQCLHTTTTDYSKAVFWVLLLNCPWYTSCFFFAEHRSPTIITISSVLLPRRVNTFLTDFALHSHGNGIMEIAAIIEGDNIYAISIQITITYTMQTCLQVLWEAALLYFMLCSEWSALLFEVNNFLWKGRVCLRQVWLCQLISIHFSLSHPDREEFFTLPFFPTFDRLL